MSVMNSTKLAAQIRSVKGNTQKLRVQIQDILVSCAYFAVKDGNINPFNQLLEATQSAVRLKGITAWAETFGFVRVKDEKFVLNKSARKEANVTDEASFEQYETDMRQVNWWEIVPAEKAESIFEPVKYMEGVVSKLEKNGLPDLAAEVTKLIDQAKKNDAIAKLSKALESEVGLATK